MSKSAEQGESEAADIGQERADANALLGAGAGIGAFGAISALVLGATCPLCVVAAPALLGVGAYKRLQARRRAKSGEQSVSSGGSVASSDEYNQ